MRTFERRPAAPAGGRGPILATSYPSSPSREAIACRAYRKWQARGCTHGGALQDRLEAEAELKAELSQ